MLELLFLVIGFAVGYCVREFISRRRRAAARGEFLQRQAQKEYDESIPQFGPLSSFAIRNPIALPLPSASQAQPGLAAVLLSKTESVAMPSPPSRQHPASA